MNPHETRYLLRFHTGFKRAATEGRDIKTNGKCLYTYMLFIIHLIAHVFKLPVIIQIPSNQVNILQTALSNGGFTVRIGADADFF